MVKAMFAAWVLAFLAGCASISDSEPVYTAPAVESPVLESINDLVLLASTANFDEIAELFGPLPEDDSPSYLTRNGPFPTGRSVFISEIGFSRSGGRWNIAVSLLGPDLVGCFEMDDLPGAVGARKVPRPHHSESDYFRLAGSRMQTEFRSFPGRFTYRCLETITFRKAG